MGTNILIIAFLLSIASSQSFTMSQVLTEKDDETYWVDITDDSSILVAAGHGKTYIYLNQNGVFSHHQTLG